MAALEDEFARAAAGEFRVVLLSGGAGVGKSRLGRELLTRHPEAAGMFARAHPLGVTAAFGVWAEAIDPLLRDRSDAQVTAACGGRLGDLASCCHRVAVIRGRLPDREPPLPRLLQGLAALLRNLAAQAALIAVLDDVHFADASSWEALRYFARHLDDTRLLVVATSRPADLADQEVAAQARFELDEDGFLRRLEVTPLDRTAEVLARSLERIRHRALRDGLVGAGEFETVLAALRDPSFTFVDALSVAAWGRGQHGPPARLPAAPVRGRGVRRSGAGHRSR